MRIMKRIAALLAVVMVAAGMASCSGSGQTSAGVTSPALMSRVTKYEIDYQTGEWYLKEVTDYEYENAYPVSVKSHDYDADMDSSRTYKYKFTGDLPSVMKSFDEEGNHDTTVSYTKKGLRNREHYYDPNSEREVIYQYGNRDEYFTLVHHESRSGEPDNPEGPKDHMEEVDSVIVNAADGLLQKTVNDGLYANWGDTEPKEWQRFMGSYTAEYDANGIVNKTSAVFSVGVSSGDQEKVELTIEDGRVTEAIVSNYGYTSETDEGKWENATKYVFEYTDIEISAARYAAMINNVVMEGGGTYYIYNWY